MSPRPLTVDGSLSWARRVGDSVHVRLRLPGSPVPTGPVTVALVGTTDRRTSAGTTTAVDGAVDVVFAVPGRELGATAWQLTVRTADGAPFVPIDARLLAAPDTPVALLPGPPWTPRRRTAPPPGSRTRAARAAAHLPSPLRTALRRARGVVGHGGS